MNNYTLHVSQPIDGNASDYSANGYYGFYYNNGMPFSTVDKASNADGMFVQYEIINSGIELKFINL